MHDLNDCWQTTKTQKTKTMSDKKHSDQLITNEDTVNRRAWIEKAVSVVKGKVKDGSDAADAGDRSGKPNLHVVNTNSPR